MINDKDIDRTLSDSVQDEEAVPKISFAKAIDSKTLIPEAEEFNIPKTLYNQSEKHLDTLFTHDICVETDLHAVDSYIDPNYHWNEWTARRDILKYAKLMSCKTKGSQTTGTYFRRDNTSQVYLPKDNASQTKRVKGTNPKLRTSHITGLAATSKISGSKDEKGVTKVTLTFDL